MKISAVHAARTLRYTLTRADAISYEASRPLLGWRKWAFLLWLGSAGMVLAAFPEDWIAGWRFWVLGALLVGLNYLVAIMVMTLASHRRAALGIFSSTRRRTWSSSRMAHSLNRVT